MAPATFCTLPLELRERIYEEVFIPDIVIDNSEPFLMSQGFERKLFKYDLSILRTNQQIHDEASSFFHARNTFVRVPIKPQVGAGCTAQSVLIGRAAESFTGHVMEVEIETDYASNPVMEEVLMTDLRSHIEEPFEYQIIRAEDLPLVIAHWVDDSMNGRCYTFFRDNEFGWHDYSVTFRLRDPGSSSPSASRALASHMAMKQRLLILPFSELTSSPYTVGPPRKIGEIPIRPVGDMEPIPAIVKELEELRLAAVDPRSRLEKTERTIAQGDRLFDSGDPVAAVEKYEQALLEMDVLVGSHQAWFIGSPVYLREPIAVNYQSEVLKRSYQGCSVLLQPTRRYDYEVFLSEPDHLDGDVERVSGAYYRAPAAIHEPEYLYEKVQGMCINNAGKGNHAGWERQRLCHVIAARMVRTLYRMGKIDEAVLWAEGTIGKIRARVEFILARPGPQIQAYSWCWHYCALPVEEALLDAPGAAALGEIYYHRGLIERERGEFVLGKSFLDVAAVYSPQDKALLAKASKCHSRMNLKIIKDTHRWGPIARCVPPEDAYE